MGHVFHVFRSGCYQWQNREPGPRLRRDQVLKEKIVKIYHKGRGYVSPRIHRQLKGFRCVKKRVEQGLPLRSCNVVMFQTDPENPYGSTLSKTANGSTRISLGNKGGRFSLA